MIEHIRDTDPQLEKHLRDGYMTFENRRHTDMKNLVFGKTALGSQLTQKPKANNRTIPAEIPASVKVCIELMPKDSVFSSMSPKQQTFQIKNNLASPSTRSLHTKPKKIEQPSTIVDRVLRSGCCWPMNKPEDMDLIAKVIGGGR